MIIDEIDDFYELKVSEFDTQHALVESFFGRGLTDEKNMEDILDAMNVHYISGVTTTGTSSTDTGADNSVYEDLFDHFTFDVAHMHEYSPAFTPHPPVYQQTPTAAPVMQARGQQPIQSQQSNYGYDDPRAGQ